MQIAAHWHQQIPSCEAAPSPAGRAPRHMAPERQQAGPAVWRRRGRLQRRRRLARSQGEAVRARWASACLGCLETQPGQPCMRAPRVQRAPQRLRTACGWVDSACPLAWHELRSDVGPSEHPAALCVEPSLVAPGDRPPESALGVPAPRGCLLRACFLRFHARAELVGWAFSPPHPPPPVPPCTRRSLAQPLAARASAGGPFSRRPRRACFVGRLLVRHVLHGRDLLAEVQGAAPAGAHRRRGGLGGGTRVCRSQSGVAV